MAPDVLAVKVCGYTYGPTIERRLVTIIKQ